MFKERISISLALQELDKKGSEIQSVSEWADTMGYTRSHFSRCFTNEFGLNPKDFLTDFKFRAIAREIIRAPDAIGYETAVNVGFADDRVLHKFLKFHRNITLSEYKRQVL